MAETPTYRALVAKIATAGGCPILRDLYLFQTRSKQCSPYHMPASARLELGMPHGHGAQPRWETGTRWKAMARASSSAMRVTQQLDTVLVSGHPGRRLHNNESEPGKGKQFTTRWSDQYGKTAYSDSSS